MTALTPQTLWGAFRIERVIGSGPSGTAYGATVVNGGRPVTLKIFHETLDEPTLARFEDDTKRLIGLSHPNILKVESVGREGGRRFFVAEPFDGRPVRDLGPRPLREACEIALKTARALGAAWMRLILHRNLKPENILVSASGDVKVTDFGLALGPTPYWAPERKPGQSSDLRSDLFSLGTIFREILGERNAEIDALLHHLTRTETYERIQMVEDVISRLEQFLSRTAAPVVITAPPPPPPPPPPPVYRPPDPVLPHTPTIPSYGLVEAPPLETSELRDARATLVNALAAVTKRLQRSIAHRMEQADARPTPPPPPPRTVLPPPPPPPAPRPKVEPPKPMTLPPILASSEPAPKKRGCVVVPIMGTIVVIAIVVGLLIFRVNARMARDQSIKEQDYVRKLDERVAEAKKKVKEAEEKAKPVTPPDPAKGKADAEWAKTKAAIAALEEELKFGEASDMCSRFVSRHGAQAPDESRTTQTELRSWSSAVQQAESFRKFEGGRALQILTRAGEKRAKDRERLLAKWCEEDWKETSAAVEKALAQTDPYSAREELVRFLKLPHLGGAHKEEAESRKLGLQADFEFRDVSDKTDYMLRSNKPDEAIAAWEAFLALPHKGGARREEVQKRIAKIREDAKRTIFASRGTINRLTVSPDGKRIAFTSDRIRVHEIESRAELWSQLPPSLMRTMSFAGDSLLVGAFSTKITVWDIAKKAELRSLKVADGYVTAMVVSRDGSRVIVARSDGALLTWEGAAEEPSKVEKDAAALVTTMTLSPDGTKLAMGALRDKSIRVRDLATGQEKKWAVSAPVTAPLAWSPDGKLLASVATETVTVWDAEKGEQLHALTGHKGVVYCITFSADGSRVAAGGGDRNIRLWNSKDGSAAGTFTGHQDRVTGLIAAPGGLLVSGGADGSVRLWSITD